MLGSRGRMRPAARPARASQSGWRSSMITIPRITRQRPGILHLPASKSPDPTSRWRRCRAGSAHRTYRCIARASPRVSQALRTPATAARSRPGRRVQAIVERGSRLPPPPASRSDQSQEIRTLARDRLGKVVHDGTPWGFIRVDQAVTPPAHPEQPGARGRDGGAPSRSPKTAAPSIEPPARRCRIDPERTRGPRGVAARIEQHVSEHAPDLERCPQHPEMKPLEQHRPAAAEHAVHGSCQA